MYVQHYHNKYSPKWIKFLLISILIHISITLILFISLPKNTLEIRVKEVKVRLLTSNLNQEKEKTSPKPQIENPKKSITKQEVDKLVFEIVSPKISKPSEITEISPTSPKVFQSQREINEDFTIKTQPKGTPSLAEGKTKTEEPKITEKETLTLPTPSAPSSKESSAKGISGNIKWIKGEPRKVIEWYEPEIPPNILRKETKVTLTFHIEPSGFISRIEITETSGEPIIDEAIIKAMRKIRFNTALYTTVASVSLTIIPK